MPYAFTYPQLMDQALSADLSTADLRRLRSTYELAEDVCDGIYRPEGEPLICHLLTTASIALAEGLPTADVCAALVHACYGLRRFEHSRRGEPSPRRREVVAAAVGSEAEALLWTYHELGWEGFASAHNAAVDSYDETTRRVLVLRLINELADLDAHAAVYSSASRLDQGPTIALARNLGHENLAEKLHEAASAEDDRTVPDFLVRDHPTTYERPARHLWERTRHERLVYTAGRAIRAARRRGIIGSIGSSARRVASRQERSGAPTSRLQRHELGSNRWIS